MAALPGARFLVQMGPRGGDRLRFFRWKEEAEKRKGEPTPEERAAFGEMLLAQDLEGARARAMKYAMKRTGENEHMARQLVDRAFTILWDRCSWDPKKVPLHAILCGIIRSERSNDSRARTKEREHEVEYLTEVETLEGSHAESPEDLLIARQEYVAGRDDAAAELEKMKAHFVETGDAVNLDWIKYSLEEIDDPAEMAALSGREPEDYYRARDRRVRYVQRLKKKQEKT
jgi:hypothetical protein